MRLMFIQTGDVREAYDLRASGAPETRSQQWYSVDYFFSLKPRVSALAALCLKPEVSYRDTRDGVDLFGIRTDWRDPGPILEQVRAWKPTHVVLRTPFPALVAEFQKSGIAFLPMLADSFPTSGLSPNQIRGRFRARRLAHSLNHNTLPVVANHNVASCKNLVEMGVHPEKILPWEWPLADRPERPAKAFSASEKLRVSYVGAIIETKGVFDLVNAFCKSDLLKQRAHLTIAGKGETQRLSRLIDSCGLVSIVDYRGLISVDEVKRLNQESHISCVLSHHRYPEGLPKTLREGLIAGTPLLVSDHPIFSALLLDGEGTRMVPERSPEAIASVLENIVRHPTLYRRLSGSTGAAYDRLRWDVLWHEVIDHWLVSDWEWFSRHRDRWLQRLSEAH
ncbi:MAG: glycosyltransferase [Pseudomonadota bacterium]